MTLHDYLATAGTDATTRWTRAKAVIETENRHDVVAAFETECRLPQAVWAAAWTVLPAALASGSWNDLSVALRGVFNGNTRAAAPVSAPSPKGRALELDRLLDAMRGAGLIGTMDAERAFVDTLRSGAAPTASYDAQLYDCPFGEHSIWSTFDEPASDQDPFRAIAPDARTVRAALGLTPPTSRSTTDIVLCVYLLPVTVSAHPPTIADAYAGTAGGAWNDEYRASSPPLQWGLTSGGRPEVVHRVISGRHLTSPAAAPSVRSLRLVS